MHRWLAALCLAFLAGMARAADAPPAPDTAFGDSLVKQYFQAETSRLTEECLADVTNLADWTSRRDEYRRQLFDMLGLDPLPERTPLEPVVTGTVDHPEFTVEKLHFQSQPGLYVTGQPVRAEGTDGPAAGDPVRLRSQSRVESRAASPRQQDGLPASRRRGSRGTATSA